MADQLDILTCTKCGAAIPFGDEPTTACPFCQTVNDVPAAYREMRASNRLDAAGRAEAERLLRTLDRPPLLATKVLARMFDLPMLAFMVAYAVPLSLYIVLSMDRFSRWIAPKLGVRSADDVPSWIAFTFGFGLLFVIIFVPRALGIYANRRATARMHLLAALSARKPKAPGGPASCRGCGAPLYVEPDALVAVCAYCGTQSCVKLATKLVAAARQTATKIATTVHDAALIDRTERRQTRRMMARELFRYAWPTAAFASYFMIVDKPKLAGIGAVLATGLLFYLVIKSIMQMGKQNAEGKERKLGNDVPGWVAWLGPVVVWGVFMYGPRLF